MFVTEMLTALCSTRITSSGWLLFFGRDCGLGQGYLLIFWSRSRTRISAPRCLQMNQEWSHFSVAIVVIFYDFLVTKVDKILKAKMIYARFRKICLNKPIFSVGNTRFDRLLLLQSMLFHILHCFFSRWLRLPTSLDQHLFSALVYDRRRTPWIIACRCYFLHY